MLTIGSVPKPFRGAIGEIQRHAVASWVALGDGVQVVLLGDEEGIAEAAREAGAQHVPDLERTDHGTPRLDSAFALTDRVARHPLRCFVNADVILYDDLLAASHAVSQRADSFLIVGQTLDVDDPESREDALARGEKRGAAALNWLVWRARQNGIVVDATHDVVAAHQRHDYAHVPGGKDEAYYGEEAARNLELAGGKSRLYTLHDASHVLRDGRLHRNPGAPLRWRENVRKAAWKLGVR